MKVNSFVSRAFKVTQGQKNPKNGFKIFFITIFLSVFLEGISDHCKNEPFNVRYFGGEINFYCLGDIYRIM